MSMFDDIDDDFEVLEEEYTEQDREDVILAEMGMIPEVAGRYRKHVSMEVLDAKEKPTEKFFKYYLECSTQEQFDLIKKNKLTKVLKEILANTEPLSDDFGHEHEEGVNRYIEMNRKLIQQNKELQDALNEAVVGQRTITGNLVYLYRLMGNMEFPEVFTLSDEDIKIIKGIKEAIGE
jgi:hypothetical protein